ncbi:glucose/arabinose dehydrogenase [Larkinella arboricola]|uniref:Glucose/arabinose dehydrogenase n=1 Tax=Larkinella arboricola TaxID=643671 RepID=A0A327WHE2_LARAB|nr:c-type cytochrome [Larkinella arboricola]RAJ90882.1 glucose/arabinose dehydrogenase [Larkinella arboricola]
MHKFYARKSLKGKSLFSATVLAGVSVLFWAFSSSSDRLPAGDADNGKLFLPDGFQAVVVVDSVGKGRHIAVNDNGDIYMKLRGVTPEGGSVALRDTNGDGKADIIRHFGDYKDPQSYGTAMRIHNGYLYYSTATTVYRNKLVKGQLVPNSKTEVVLTDDYPSKPYRVEHVAKPVTFDDKGFMYVPFGAPGDVCQVESRKPGSPGKMPCEELDWHGGVWKFDANKLNQVQKDGVRYATGIRSIVAMDWNKQDGNLFALQHGRDSFTRIWPDLYSPWQSAVLPSEEFFKVTEGMDGGWPYYYYDQIQGKKVLNPEYGGDGKKEGKASEVAKPIIGFPGHWAPNDLVFYTGNQFPERYKNGAFIAFHGSTIRAPYPQSGYFVCFVPFKNGLPSGPWEVFADGFAQLETIVSTADAHARPVGLSIGPDGSLYVSESVRGKIWRIMYKGDKKKFGARQLAAMEKRKLTSNNIRMPDEIKDNLQKDNLQAGAKLYNTYCGPCHLNDGNGDGNRFPPLVASEWVSGNSRKLIEVVLKGLSGPITVKGKPYSGVMPAHDFLNDEDAAQILTYIRMGFKNNASAISAAEVKSVRSSLTGK